MKGLRAKWKHQSRLKRKGWDVPEPVGGSVFTEFPEIQRLREGWRLIEMSAPESEPRQAMRGTFARDRPRMYGK